MDMGGTGRAARSTSCARSCSPPETRAIVATHMYSPVACQCGTSSINLPAIVLSQRSAGSAQSGATIIYDALCTGRGEKYSKLVLSLDLNRR